MREADRIFTDDDELEVLRRFVALRERLGLPRLYFHGTRRRYYRIGPRWYTLRQLDHFVGQTEREARREELRAERMAA